MPPLPGTLISTGARPSSSFNHGRRPLLPIAGQRPISSTSRLPVPSLSHEPLSSFSMASTWGSPLQPRLAGSPQGAGMLLPIHRATSCSLSMSCFVHRVFDENPKSMDSTCTTQIRSARLFDVYFTHLI
ncbi:hypothetical protein ZEAMMB73_Zm00001d029986 [Zea mays]|uniref:Uncharacterized protein n=1 Tax=Zea mays TaxID=4577 RepID=A0A1D6K8T7_MAIZE|nr:hypothetical protein ZEAMMB73_Zm00001d029986 [Zea mays]